MISAVIFDMDGLLIDSEPFWREAERQALHSVGIGLTMRDFHEQAGTRIDEVVAHYYRNHPWQGPSQKDVEAQIVDSVIRLVKERGRPRPGALETLKLCRRRGLKLALASSSLHEVIDAVVDTLQIRQFFDVIHSAEHESHGKPHPAVFLTTAERLKALPHDILVFEDAPAGVLAAKAARMTCVAVPEPYHREHKFVQTADLILDSLEEFTEAVLDDIS